MSLDEIRKSILSEAQTKASQIDSEAAKEAQRITKDAEERAKDVLKNAEHEAAVEVGRLRKESEAGAETEANSMLIEARGYVVERSLKDVLGQAEKELSKNSMKQILDHSIKQFKQISGGNFTIKTSKKNSALLEKTAYEVEYDDVDGFMLYTDHRKIALNATVSNIVSHEEDSARKLIAEELFGGGAQRAARSKKESAKPKPEKRAKAIKKAKAKRKRKR